MRKHVRLIVIVLSVLIGITGIYAIVKASGVFYSYGQPQVVDCLLNSSGDTLYVSYHSDNAVVEINTNTMNEIRRINISRPTFMSLSADNIYLYTISSYWPSYLKRIRLSDLQISSVEIEGYAVNMDIDDQNHRLWVVGGIWPFPTSYVGEDDVDDNPGSGRLFEINLLDFTIARVVEIDPVPVSVLYSQDADLLYVLHEGRTTQINGPNEEDWIIANTVHVYDLESLREVDNFFGGREAIGTFPPAQLTKWDDTCRYLAIPDPSGGYPLKSFRIVDTYDHEIYFDLLLNGDDVFQLGFKFAHKVQNSDYLWTVSCMGVHDQSIFDSASSAARINTLTQEYEFFTIDGVTTQIGDFAVSPDGNTLYFPVIYTGEIIVWSPD